MYEFAVIAIMLIMCIWLNKNKETFAGSSNTPDQIYETMPDEYDKRDRKFLDLLDKEGIL